MKSKLLSDRTSPEFRRFESAMHAILSVSKAELNKALAEEKTANAGKPKRGPKPKHASTSAHVSGDKD
jgi:hypothetical protein